MLQDADTIQLLYTPIETRPMNVVVFGSGSGTNLKALLQAQHQIAQSGQPLPFEVKALFTDRRCRFQEIGAAAGIPVIYHSFANFFKSPEHMNPQDDAARCLYDMKNLTLLLAASESRKFSIDLILLAGYMRLLYPPLLEAFKNKIINIHPADLTQLNDQGERKYVGAHAVRDALEAGETRTRSSVIIVDAQIDTGPILASGPWVPYEEGYPLTQDKIDSHQKKQKVLSDWPSCIKTIKYISQGRIGIDDNNHVYVDDVLQPACGLEINI